MSVDPSAVRRELGRRAMLSDYQAFVLAAHKGHWKKSRAAGYLCRALQQFLEADTKNPYDILVISMPPQHGKSMTVTETLPAWVLCKNPRARIITISYNESFAAHFCRRNREKLRELGGLFGVSLAKSPCSTTEFELEGHTGGMLSRGLMSGVTGRACDLLLIDDPIKNRQEADSPTYRQRIWNEWECSYKTRLSAGAKVVVIQTRWHEDDFAGRLLKTEQNITLLNLPCAAEEKDPLGRRPGEALCPEIGKDDRWLAAFRESYLQAGGQRAWNALFQGQPTVQEGNLLNRGWWQYYEKLPPLSVRFLSLDASFKGGEGCDYVALQLWGMAEGRFYLVDALRERLGFVDTLAAVRSMLARHPATDAILVEDKANGSAVIDVLRRELPHVVAVTPQGGKVARVNAVSAAIEGGRVYLPRYAAFTGPFVEECTAFPLGAHDDQVDCMSQALHRLLFHGTPTAPVPPPFPDFNLPKKRSPLGQGDGVRII